MNPFEYRAFYEKIGAIQGWDFSHLKVRIEGVQWEFFEEVTNRCCPSDLLLDIGTGGGERLLTVADSAYLLIGIDHADSMIQTANAHLQKSQRTNVRFIQMDAEQLDFPSGFFNVVLCRQSHFNAQQVKHVLAQDGVFLTQQIGATDKQNIKQAFGRGQHFRPDEKHLKEKYVSELAAAGFTRIQAFEYDAIEYYESYEDLVYLLKHTPIVPHFGEQEQDFEILRQFIEANQTEKGIRTNAHRFLIIATFE